MAINPVFFERTKDGEAFYDIHSKLIKDRTIFLSGEIDFEDGSNIAALLLMLDAEDHDKKITIWINTPGGDAYAFLAIYDAMQFIKAPVETICINMAQSAGALILASGSKGKRFAMPNSKIMIHQIQANISGGSGTDIEIEAANIKEINNSIIEILAKHTGNTFAKVKKDCKHDKYLNAKQALAYGLIDYIYTYSKDVPLLKNKKD